MSKQTVMQVRCTIEEKARWRAYAKERGVRLSEYVRDLLNEGLGEGEANEVHHAPHFHVTSPSPSSIRERAEAIRKAAQPPTGGKP